MLILQQALFVIIIFLCIYALIDRVCRCVEYCKEIKAHRCKCEERQYEASGAKTNPKE